MHQFPNFNIFCTARKINRHTSNLSGNLRFTCNPPDPPPKKKQQPTNPTQPNQPVGCGPSPPHSPRPREATAESTWTQPRELEGWQQRHVPRPRESMDGSIWWSIRWVDDWGNHGQPCRLLFVGWKSSKRIWMAQLCFFWSYVGWVWLGYVTNWLVKV